ncbi:MAG: response regulator transcription factor [Acidimicrobiia bacterium]|nr:response regulator transcription factor [Acidimicrobiia bacterium]
MGLIQDDRIRVYVVTADEHLASLLRQALQTDGGFSWSGWAHRRETAVDEIPDRLPHVLLSDLSVPGSSDIPACELLLDKFPQIPVVVVTKRTDGERAVDAIRLGVAGYVIFDDGLELVPEAARRAVTGKLTFSDGVLEALTHAVGRTRPHTGPREIHSRSLVDSAAWEAAATLTDSAFMDLTAREAQVMSELARGHDNRTIGRHLGVTDGTVATYIKRIRHKLGAATRTELTGISVRMGLGRR